MIATRLKHPARLCTRVALLRVPRGGTQHVHKNVVHLQAFIDWVLSNSIHFSTIVHQMATQFEVMFGQSIRVWHKPLRRLPTLQHRMDCAGEINQICISLMFDPMKTHHYWAGVHSGVFQWWCCCYCLVFNLFTVVSQFSVSILAMWQLMRCMWIAWLLWMPFKSNDGFSALPRLT